MAQEGDHPFAPDAESVFRQMEKRLRNEERRPQIRQASDLMGPGLAPHAVPVTDMDGDVAAFNSIVFAPAGTLNTPNAAKDWIGETIATRTDGGRQTLSTFRAADAPHETWSRAFNYVPGTLVRIYTPWVRIVGGPVDEGRGTAAERDAFFGVPATNATRAALANRRVQWYNTTTGWWESYYAASTVTGLTVPALLAGHATGWYPAPGSILTAHRGKTNAFQSLPAGSQVAVVLNAFQQNVGGFASSGTAGLTVPVGGYYDINARVYFSGAGSQYTVCVVRIGGNNFTSGNDDKNAVADVTVPCATVAPLLSTQVVELHALTQASVSAWGTTGYNGSYLDLSYKAPPLAN